MDEIAINQESGWKKAIWPVCFILFLSFVFLFAEKSFIDSLRNPNSVIEYPGWSSLHIILMLTLSLGVVGSFASIVFEKIGKINWKLALFMSFLLFLLVIIFAFLLFPRSQGFLFFFVTCVWSAFISVVSFWTLYFLTNIAKKISKNFLLIVFVLSLAVIIVKPYLDYYTEPIYFYFQGTVVFAERISQEEALSIITDYGLTQQANQPTFDGKILNVVSGLHYSYPDPGASKNQANAEIERLSQIMKNNDLIESVKFLPPGKFTVQPTNQASSHLEPGKINSIESVTY